MRRTIPVVASILLLASVAPVAAEGSDARSITVTWSPVHLVLPLVEVAGEFKVAPKIGVGVIAGAGRISDTTGTVTATAYEAGGQFNYYIMAPFSGLHAGAEAIYMHVGDVEQDQSLTAAGLSLGPYAGYKVMTSFGFTFVAQLGVQFLAVRAENSSQTASDKKVFPLLNLNVGWSF